MGNSVRLVARNVRIVGLCTFASRILGMLRDVVMAATFGNGMFLDAFTVAFRLPNLARVLLGEGVMATAFLPEFIKAKSERGGIAARQLTTAVAIVLGATLCFFVLMGEMALWPFWSSSAAWGAALETPLETVVEDAQVGVGYERALLAWLSALMLPYVILICLAAQLGAVLQALGKFTVPALVPVLLNVVWLATLWLIVPAFPTPLDKLNVICVGVLVGGFCQLVFPFARVWQLGYGFHSQWKSELGAVRALVITMLPVLFGLSITQLNTLLDSLLAWGLAAPEGATPEVAAQWPLTAGTAAALYLGQRLYQFPLGVFGVSLGTVLFPLLTAHAQKNDTSALNQDLGHGVRLVLAIGIPASAGLVLLAPACADTIFRHGKFNAEDAAQTARLIQAYGTGVWAYCGLLIAQRACFAMGDRRSPMMLGAISLVLNFLLNITLVWPLGGIGLALSTAIVAAIQFLATLGILERRLGQLDRRAIGVCLQKTAIATGGMAVACVATEFALGWWWPEHGRIVRLCIPLGTGLVTFAGLAALVRLPEPFELFGARRQS